MAHQLNTFSIVARCSRTGQLGVAVATAVPAVGGICPYVQPRIGAVSTQSWVNPYLALDVLKRLRGGMSAQAALDHALAADPAADVRQLGLVDRHGASASWTGSKCTPWCGQITADGMAVQGNMLIGEATLTVMASAYQQYAEADLAERLMCALEAGDAAGGDKRGKQSAALVIYANEDYPHLDVRVDEHAEPVRELRRVLEIARLQLVPFVEGMPRRDSPPTAAPDHVTAMLLRPPPDRPGGGGSRPLSVGAPNDE